ncbi:hypothetical protein [Agromyces marinus]|nr:hypothetical protein [Agromyces marinus]UIP57485.1 hypothetical protein DSM26151_03460 [Agromyces marinus]
MRTTTRAGLALAAVAALALVGLAAPAHAAPGKSSAPAASATAGTPDAATITIDYAINRGAQAIASQACDIDGEPVACDDAADTTTKKAATYSVDLENLTDGEHEFTVAFTLTDGGTAAASAPFVIDAMTPLEAACASLTGTLTIPAHDDGAYWKCVADPYTGPQTDMGAVLGQGFTEFGPYCPSGDFSGSFASWGPVLRAIWYCVMI